MTSSWRSIRGPRGRRLVTPLDGGLDLLRLAECSPARLHAGKAPPRQRSSAARYGGKESQAPLPAPPCLMSGARGAKAGPKWLQD